MTTTFENRENYIFSNLGHYYENPIELRKSSGPYVIDTNNTRYLDFIGGIVTISIGHNHPRIKKKMLELLEEDSIQHTSTLYFSEHMGKAAKKLIELSKLRDSAVYFSNSGSEANEIACLTAREATKRQLIISLRHGYHGGTNATLNLCGHSSWKFPSQPHSQTLHAEAPYCFRCPYGGKKESCAIDCAEDLDRLIQTCTAGEVAAVIVEPIMGVGGFIDGPKKYFKRIHEIIKDNGGLYISDEVQTGVGRLGQNFLGIQDFDIEPDIVTMAKGLGNGVPVGATIAKKNLIKSLMGKTHFSTFGGDPYQMAQVFEVLSEIDERNLQENAKNKGSELKAFLESLTDEFSFIGDVRGRGLLLGVEIVGPDGIVESPELTNQILEAAREKGLLIGKGGLKGNVIRIAPPLSIDLDHLNEFKEKFKDALMRVSFDNN